MIKKRSKLFFTNRGALIDKGSIYVVVILTLLIFGGFIMVGGTLPTTLPSPNSSLVQLLAPPAQPTGTGLQLGYFLGVSPTPVPTKVPDVVSPLSPFEPVVIPCDSGISGNQAPQMIWGVTVDISGAGGDELAIKAFYTSNNALQLGSGAVSQMRNHPSDSVTNPAIGNATARDANNFPAYPALFLTDVTLSASGPNGDAQSGGTPNNPDYVYGAWKAAGGPNPAKNGPPGAGRQDRGPNADPWPPGNVPGGDRSFDYTAEVVWKVSNLTAFDPATGQQISVVGGNKYKIQVVLHDGASPSNIGVACMIVNLPISAGPPPPPSDLPPETPVDDTLPPPAPPPVFP
jgi:hypothetical protein